MGIFQRKIPQDVANKKTGDFFNNFGSSLQQF